MQCELGPFPLNFSGFGMIVYYIDPYYIYLKCLYSLNTVIANICQFVYLFIYPVSSFFPTYFSSEV